MGNSKSILFLCKLAFLALTASGQQHSLVQDTVAVNKKIASVKQLVLEGRYGDAGKEIEIVRKSSKQLNYPEGAAAAMLYSGIISYNQSRYETSVAQMDSCLRLYKEQRNTVGEVNAINYKAKAFSALFKETEAIDLLDQSEKLARQYNDSSGLALSFYLRGSVLADKGMYQEAEPYFRQSLDIRKALKDSVGIAASYSFLGLDLSFMGNYTQALDYIQKSIVIRERKGDKRGLANSYLNQYKILYVMKEWEQAMQSEFKSLAICSEIKDEQCVSGRYTNIGELYQKLGDYEKALSYHYKALQISRKIGIKNREAQVLNNLSRTFIAKNEFSKALSYADSAMAIRNTIADNEGMAESHYTIALIASKTKDVKKALAEADEALMIADKFKLVTLSMDIHRFLSDTYRNQNEHKKALEHFDAYISIRDSIYNIETSKSLTKKQLNFQFEQQRKIEDLERQKEEALAKEEIQRQRFLRNSLFIGLGILAVVLFVVFRSSLQRKRLNKNLRDLNYVLQDQKQELETQKERIEEQHALIETKNKEITDSIYYAKNIQSALMPADSDFAKYFEDFFIFFRPKDIISGDFYWISEKENKIIFVTADCTGHGIPGGFMSMLGISLLNEIINEYALTEPGLVMSKLRKKLIATLKQKGQTGEQQDGMDLSFLLIDKENMQLTYATANHSFYIVRTENGEKQLIQLKGDKQPVGIYAGKIKPFTQATIELRKGDVIYTMTDGFADQFGGPKGKKFKYKPLLDLLLTNALLPCTEQQRLLSERFDDWKGHLEQVDDVCIIGVSL